MEDSVFTKIINGEIPSFKIYEDELTLAFLDINPLTKGHTLVIPKQQIDHLDDCPEDVYLAIFSTVHKVSKHLKEHLKPERITLAVHGYDVPHAHVHVVPSYNKNDLKFPESEQTAPDFESLKVLSQDLSIK